MSRGQFEGGRGKSVRTTQVGPRDESGLGSLFVGCLDVRSMNVSDENAALKRVMSVAMAV